MEFILDTFEHILDPDWIMKNGGLYLVLIILFIETGVIFGFFLPGDPLLFLSGVVIASTDQTHYPFGNELLNLSFWMTLFILSTTLGNYLGYWFGNKFKYLIIRQEDTWFLKQKHIKTAHDFYEKRGGFAIAIARFLPIVRTFAPIVAGAVQMDYGKFTYYNILGAIIWVVSLTSLGYILGDNPFIQRNLEYLILGIILIVTIPVLLKLINKKNKNES